MPTCLPPLVEFDYEHDLLIVEPKPDLNRATSTRYEDELKCTFHSLSADPEFRSVVVDLGQTHFFSSALLGFLIALWKITKRRGGGLAMCGVSAFGHSVLQVAHLHKLWPIVRSREDAIRSLLEASQANGRSSASLAGRRAAREQ
jgi:anti-anti-sigma factor